MPWVVALILGGMVIGPFGFGFLKPDSVIEFLGQVGLIFLMFAAGLETKLSTFKQSKKDIAIISIFNGVIPFIAGFSVGYFLGFPLMSSLLFGIILMSSSAAVVIPVFESMGIIGNRLSRTVIASVIVQDVFSLLLLSIFFQSIAPTSNLPIAVFLVLLIGIFLFFRFIIPKVQWFFSLGANKVGDVFQQELRVVFTILIGVVAAFQLLGLHSIIAGFIAGLLLSDVVNTQALKDKIHVVSYGLFIPIFFVILGSKTDISVFGQIGEVLIFTFCIVLASVFSKFSSGFIAGKVLGYKKQEARFIGASTIPSLSVTLAVAFAGVELGLLSSQMATAFVVLSLITVLVSPVLIRLSATKILEKSISEPNHELN